jgi:hypothetical protein
MVASSVTIAAIYLNVLTNVTLRWIILVVLVAPTHSSAPGKRSECSTGFLAVDRSCSTYSSAGCKRLVHSKHSSAVVAERELKWRREAQSKTRLLSAHLPPHFQNVRSSTRNIAGLFGNSSLVPTDTVDRGARLKATELNQVADGDASTQRLPASRQSSCERRAISSCYARKGLSISLSHIPRQFA